MKQILLIGGAGYIGTMLAENLNNVTVVDPLFVGGKKNKNCNFIKKEAANLKPEFISKFHTIVYLGGISSDPMAEFNPYFNFIHNTAQPTYIAKIAKENGVKRFIYASSCSIYDGINEECTETCIVNPVSTYAVSKYQTEQGIKNLISKDFSVIILRKGTVSGFSKKMRFDLCVNSMYKDQVTKNEIYVDKQQVYRPILYIGDTINAYKLAINADKDISGIFNIANYNFSIQHIAKIIQNYTGCKIIQKYNKNVRNYKVNCDKARDILDFKPHPFCIEKIYKELYDNIGNKFDFNNKQYYNIEMFKETLKTRG